MNWIVQKLELQIIIVKPNLIIKDPKRIGSVALIKDRHSDHSGHI
jgi:hypothetical protein